MPVKIVIIDNYDSFTYNLVHYFAGLGADVTVVRNDTLTVTELAALSPDKIVISPGPGVPKVAGICVSTILKFAKKLPILGVCLGHQSIGYAFGGCIIHAKRIMHGKTTPIYHNNTGVFKDLSNPFTATRYHSLVIAQNTLPDCLKVTAWTRDEVGNIDEIMGIQHKTLKVTGVQFHPESILTEHGHDLLRNFLVQ